MYKIKFSQIIDWLFNDILIIKKKNKTKRSIIIKINLDCTFIKIHICTCSECKYTLHTSDNNLKILHIYNYNMNYTTIKIHMYINIETVTA
jgi:hypothetical protein